MNEFLSMRIPVLYHALLIVILFTGCKRQPDCERILNQVSEVLNAGNLKKTGLLADSLKAICGGENQLINKADSMSQIAERIYLEFPFTEEQIISQLNRITDSFSPEDQIIWEKRNWLEWRMIDGEKRYFNRAVSNLDLIKSFHLQRTVRDSLKAEDPEIVFRKKHTQSVIKSSGNQHVPVVPAEMIVNYTLSVHPDAVPEGETVRCWLPWPKENNIRQQNVRFISASNDNYIISPDSMIHRTIYMEAGAEKGQPVVFQISFSYESSGQYFDPDNLNILPYNKNSLLYREYTSEQRPHICFTEDVRRLADSIAGQEANPFEIVRKIYLWVNRNIAWSGALEYSVMPNITQYVLRNRRGDCGMQTFLIMSMLRYKGIPVKWQSGWMMPPGDENLHDWCEVYFEGPGWIPVDISYGLQYSNGRKTREFYISGIDSYRLIINDGVSGALFPEKRYLRSEPYDFQRGEVEWSGGNLYFDKWDYEMKIEYKK